MHMYSVTEFAKLLNYNRRTIYRWVKAGKLEHYVFNGQTRIPHSEYERLLKECKVAKKD